MPATVWSQICVSPNVLLQHTWLAAANSALLTNKFTFALSANVHVILIRLEASSNEL